MNIAITADGDALDNNVFSEFSKTPYLLIVNVDTMQCTAIPHAIRPGSDEELAQIILDYNCEAVITGKLEEKAFNLLADNSITRYAAAHMLVSKSLEQMDNRKLEFIRNVEGSSSCSGHHYNSRS
ncbi:NifB/NifX family molybdenum-iron cluster-binding protein [Desulforhopalus sp. 52FAK]